MKNYFFMLVCFVLLFSCEKKLPSSPTIVTGKVVDESEMPIEGYEFHFTGFHSTGWIKGYYTFSIKSSTNKEGIFTLSQVIPEGSELIEFSPVGLKLANGSYDVLYSDIYLLKNANYVQPSLTGPILAGTTNSFKYKVIKRKP